MNGRAGTYDGRGNNKDRRARKLWLLRTFNPELGPDACRCVYCKLLLDYRSMTVDRRIAGACGGSYRRGNIQPTCLYDNQSQGKQMWWKLQEEMQS